VIAVGGQTIEARHKQVYIDAKPWDDPHVRFLESRSIRTVTSCERPYVSTISIDSDHLGVV